jgi:hypothetical protein
MHEGQARASVFAKKYCAQKSIAEDSDSVDILEMMFFINDPSKHGSFGSTKDWKSSVNDVSKYLDAESFDKWLWEENV